ncbi:MAG: hypothetical protein HFK04_03390 [Oscillospiraceae bacterium]|nr:hypothetical protein [Oscillospiraceae bacterium]
MMESPFKNDPFAMIYQAFKRLYPDKPCEIWWDIPQEADKQAFGMTEFPDDGSCPQVFIYSNHPVHQQVEILAHELAHVAVWPDHEHDDAWDFAFSAIQQEYGQIVTELFW